MDALRLGRGMTYKYAAAGVNLGGGKAVIIGDPKTQKTEALIRAMGRFIQSLHGEYKTGEDVGTTLDDMELLYQETEHVITLPEYCGGAGNIGPATAFGVQQAMKACAQRGVGLGPPAGPHDHRPGPRRGRLARGRGAREGRRPGHRGRYRPRQGRARPARVRRDRRRPRRDPRRTRATSTAPTRSAPSSTTTPSPSCDARSCAAAPTTSSPRSATAISLHERGILYAPDYIANAGGTIFDTDRIAQKGGFNRERAWRNVSRIRERMAELIDISKRERIPTWLAANRLAERRLEMARQLRMI